MIDQDIYDRSYSTTNGNSRIILVRSVHKRVGGCSEVTHVTHAYREHNTRERISREASDTNASVSRLVGQDNEIHALLMHESTTFSIFT